MVFGEKVIDLAAIKKRLEEATPGPWKIHTGYNRFQADPGCYGNYLEIGSELSLLASSVPPKTLNFIAHAPTDIANLLDALEKCKKQLKYVSETYVAEKNENDRLLKEIFEGETK